MTFFIHMKPVLQLTVGPGNTHNQIHYTQGMMYTYTKMTICTNMYHMCCHGDVGKLELLMLVVEQPEVVDQQVAVSERDIIMTSK